jgi:hypothetical protein
MKQFFKERNVADQKLIEDYQTEYLRVNGKPAIAVKVVNGFQVTNHFEITEQLTKEELNDIVNWLKSS